jgi:hypothetical protein
MSAIAQFVKLPKTALDGLAKAATPKKSLFGRTHDGYQDYLRQHGEQAASNPWSGHILATVLPYLEEKHQIDLMKSDYDALARTLTTVRKATHFVFTNELRAKYLDKLNSLSVPEEEVRDYYNQFNAANESAAGKPMLDGLNSLRQALSMVDDSSVIVFVIS